ncbi:MAG TPA: enoyl-CoA hydratase/isomerase family protein [Acidimicrobiales bacterium]|jgi:enoyl-CoA hydratase/carnithine racemase|nr:enoyl-CoA hydratase/isomerase family protein [Acidimicrobiales bacterium]
MTEVSTGDPVVVEDLEDRVVIRLNRPEVRNAINAEVVARLHEVCASLEAQPRPAVLTGSDGVFAAGADVGELVRRGREDALAGINSSLFERVRRLPLPTVAAVDGPALGGGAELAYACDLRVASTRARFANPEPGLGIIAGAGACWRLRELVGEGLAKEVLLAGRQLDAEEAKAARLVARVVDPEELLGAAHELVDRMTRSSPLALRLTKLAVDASPDAHPGIDHLAQAVLFEHPEKVERMTSFLERRRAREARR